MTHVLLIRIMILLTSYTQSGTDKSAEGTFRVQRPVRTVLILGNSIVRHAPAPSLGWKNDWGMAASSADSDFVHRLIDNIHRQKPTVKVRYLNIAGWEREYKHYPLARFDSLRNPDVLLLRVAENVNDQQAVDSGFVDGYNRLIAFLDPNQTAVKVITDGFWANRNVNSMIQAYARQHHYGFVSLTDLSADPTNMAQAQYAHEGVGRHPSDKGMRLIANRIWTVLEPYIN